MPERKNKAKLFETKCFQCNAPIVRIACTVKNRARVFCNQICAGKTNGALARRSVPPFPVRFWEKVNKHGPIIRPELGPCWVWTGARDRDGYGSIKANGKSDGAHRVSWKLLNGAIAVELCVLHRCDNPPCVRPEHLFLGTKKDNIRDSFQKGRGHSQKLTMQQAQTIRAKYKRGGITWRELGVEYGVTTGHVGHIIHFRVHTN